MPHPFSWVPGQGARHATTDPRPPHSGLVYPPDVPVSALCGRAVTTAGGVTAWLWETCPECDERARALVGAPSRAEIRAHQNTGPETTGHRSTRHRDTAHPGTAHPGTGGHRNTAGNAR
ncbi:zinc finger protein [Salinifilum ghardaiensis]